jgi:hypothetical protein
MFVIYHDISKTLDVLVHLLYRLSIPHKNRTFQPTSGLTRIVMWSPPPTFFCIFLQLNLNNFFVLKDTGAFYISKCRYIKYLSNKIKLTSMGIRVWVLNIQNPKNRIFFRKFLNSNLNNFFVLTDRRTFYIQKCRYYRYLSNKKDLISMGCWVWVLWATKIRKI